MTELCRVLGTADFRPSEPTEFETSNAWAESVLDDAFNTAQLRSRKAWPPHPRIRIEDRWLKVPASEDHVDWLEFARLQIVADVTYPLDHMHKLASVLVDLDKQYIFDFDMPDRAPALFYTATDIKKSRSLYNNNAVAFVPSVNLSGYLVRGFSSQIAHSKMRSQIETVVAKPSLSRMAEVFSIQFKRLIATLANRVRHNQRQTRTIAEGARFDIPFQHTMLDRFILVPDEVTPFFSLLLEELTGYLSGGGTMTGRWGEFSLLCRYDLYTASAA